MNIELINGLIKERFVEVVIEIKHTGILNTFSRSISIEKERKVGNLLYDGSFLETTLKEITNKMIEEEKSFKKIKLKDLLENGIKTMNYDKITLEEFERSFNGF